MEDAKSKIKPQSTVSNTHEDIAQALREEFRRRSEFRDWLEYVAIKDIADEWLKNPQLSEKYSGYMKELFHRGLIHSQFADGKSFTIREFRHLHHRLILESIKNLDDLPTDAKSEMILCYTAFINFLNDMSYGWFSRALMVTREYKINPEAVVHTLSLTEWRTFIDVLEDINPRDALIARLIIHGRMRISEALTLTIDQVDFHSNTICLKQRKKEYSIPYAADFIQELNEYLQDTSSFRGGTKNVFITKNGKRLARSQLNYTFNQARKRANIVKVITPELLRSTGLIFEQQETKEAAIMENKKTRIHKGNKIE